jgi:hypothetical protein
MTIEETIKERIKNKPVELTELVLYEGRFQATFLIKGIKRHCIITRYKKGKAIQAAMLAADSVIEYAKHKGLI